MRCRLSKPSIDGASPNVIPTAPIADSSSNWGCWYARRVGRRRRAKGDSYTYGPLTCPYRSTLRAVGISQFLGMSARPKGIWRAVGRHPLVVVCSRCRTQAVRSRWRATEAYFCEAACSAGGAAQGRARVVRSGWRAGARPARFEFETLHIAARPQDAHQITKVFCFFFQKRKLLLTLSPATAPSACRPCSAPAIERSCAPALLLRSGVFAGRLAKPRIVAGLRR